MFQPEAAKCAFTQHLAKKYCHYYFLKLKSYCMNKTEKDANVLLKTSHSHRRGK